MPRFYPLEMKLKKAGFLYIAGVDEAGRGPLAGPVVSASVILKENAKLDGLTDSKKLSAKKREELFPEIIRQCLDFSITAVPNQIIDEINILNATRLANAENIKRLKIKPDIAVMDGRDKQFLEIPFINIIKGDLYIKSIAAASVLAKVFRDRLMLIYSEIYPNYGFEKSMGYGTREHRNLLEKFGQCEIHRKSFKLKEKCK